MKLGLTTTTRSISSPLLPAADAPGGKATANVPPSTVRRTRKRGRRAAVVEDGLAAVIEAASGLLARMDAPVADRKGKKRRGPAELRALAEAFVDLLVGLFADSAWLSSILRHDARRERAPGAGRAAAAVVADGARPVLDAIALRLEEMRARGEIRRDVDAKHLLLSCVAMIAFPLQQEPLVTAFWPVDWRAPAHLAERKRDMVELILARVLP